MVGGRILRVVFPKLLHNDRTTDIHDAYPQEKQQGRSQEAVHVTVSIIEGNVVVCLFIKFHHQEDYTQS